MWAAKLERQIQSQLADEPETVTVKVAARQRPALKRRWKRTIELLAANGYKPAHVEPNLRRYKDQTSPVWEAADSMAGWGGIFDVVGIPAMVITYLRGDGGSITATFTKEL